MSLTVSTDYVENHAIIGDEVVILKAVWSGIELVEGEYYKVYKGNSSFFTAMPILETLQESQLPAAQQLLNHPEIQRNIFTAIKNTFHDKAGHTQTY